MATEQYLTNSLVHNQPLGDGTEECKSSSAPTDINPSGGFDCNICLDTVHDPVVTMCGHLYCWPCIYKWIHQQSISPETLADQHPQCPVCKAEISERTLIPLYGRGESDGDAANLDLIIPDRPRGPACGVHTHHHPGYLDDYNYTSAPAISPAAGNTTSHPIISMFGEMIYARLFGYSQSFSTYPISYGMGSVGSMRARQHILHADRSLSRLSFFLCCCLVLCLVLF